MEVRIREGKSRLRGGRAGLTDQAEAGEGVRRRIASLASAEQNQTKPIVAHTLVTDQLNVNIYFLPYSFTLLWCWDSKQTTHSLSSLVNIASQSTVTQRQTTTWDAIHVSKPIVTVSSFVWWALINHLRPLSRGSMHFLERRFLDASTFLNNIHIGQWMID